MSNKAYEETFTIRFTEKGKALNKAILDGFNEWLRVSEISKEELLALKNVRGFHIVDDELGFYMAYYDRGVEKQIGAGFYKEQYEEATWIFGYACALLDSGNNYKSSFSKEYIKWGKKHER